MSIGLKSTEKPELQILKFQFFNFRLTGGAYGRL